MSRRLLFFAPLAVVALAALLLLADPAAAQRRGVRGVSPYTGPYTNFGGDYGYTYNPYYGGGFYGPYNNPANWNQYNSGYYNPYYGGYDNRYYGYDRSYYNPGGYGRNWNWADSDYSYDNSGYYTDGNSNYTYGAQRGQRGMPHNAALIQMIVAANAELWINGERQQQTGAVRSVMTPTLEDPDKEYAYEVRMRWNEGGRTVDKTRRITFKAGDRLMVDMSRGDDRGYAYGAERRDRTDKSEGSKALIDIMVPPNAELWIAGDKTQQTGMHRTFITPELSQDRDFTYPVKARWRQGDRTIEQERNLTVHAGERVMLDLTSAGQARRTDRTDVDQRNRPDTEETPKKSKTEQIPKPRDQEKE